MSSWSTRPGGEPVRPQGGDLLSPTLLFHKWQEYDRRDDGEPIWPLDRKDSALDFLQQVAKAASAVLGVSRQDSRSYAWWLEERYLPALRGLGASFTRAETLWRMVVGFGVNPAWESGLVLHPLYGFPYIPGSAVKGLGHHVAEMDLVGRLEVGDRPNGPANGGKPPLPAPEILQSFLAEAEEIRSLFGSLTMTEASDPAYHADGAPWPPRALLESWRKEVDKETGQKIQELLTHTGGRLVFYDAVPLTQASDLLQPDLLNPHYREYYDSEGTEAPPSDDQSPVPVYFLTVRPGVRFVFPYRLRRAGAAGAAGEGESAQGADPLGKVQIWLETGLTAWGAGAKTAAGYGYFQAVRHLEAGEDLKWQKAPPDKPKPTEDEAAGQNGTVEEPAVPPTSTPLASLRAAFKKARSTPKATSRPVEKDSRVKAEVLEATQRGYRLRIFDTGQEDVYCNARVRWEVGQKLKVLVTSLHPDGRVKTVKP